MHDRWPRSCKRRGISDRVIEGVYDFDQLQRFATASIEAAAEVEAPVIDHGGSEVALFGNRMHDVRTLHPVGMRRSRDVMEIEAGDRRGHDASLAIDDRMMNQRNEEVCHLGFSTPKQIRPPLFG